ncbi:sensor histidine kinase [Leptolyngbya sp. PCC 6406]|uniref:sensor histidine kinase n=1 Tax=Leptolyngbya sp. PCC 6406 TaxID=1173264 RepID=UPI0002ACE4D4|nr:HAMP domain-containing sensor histidine kinase [Leptolyngbya sp. PCC 6406]
MLMSASPEFVTLCQSQVMLTGQSLGASSTAVYLAENWRDQALPELIPVATYPAQGIWSPSDTAATAMLPHMLPAQGVALTELPGMESSALRGSLSSESATEAREALSEDLDGAEMGNDRGADVGDDRVVIPLVHESLVMGVLVSWRSDRPWKVTERHQLERVAHTLALACVLDQRGQWIQAQLHEHRRDQAQQSERLHDLLHQVRNPLTALKTFGKLLTKRLEPSDKNHPLAAGIVRESDRMTDLLGYFDQVLQRRDARLTAVTLPPLLPPAADSGSAASVALHRDWDLAFNSTELPRAGFGGPLAIQPCLLGNLLPALLASVPTLAVESQIQFQVVIPENLAVISADPMALREVVMTLLENAFKYCPVGSLVWVEAGVKPPVGNHDTGGAARFYQGLLVGDTGPGIPVVDQPRIFERQYRGIQAQGTIPGTGLGLAIVQELVQRMGGWVDVYSPLSTWPGSLCLPLPSGACDRGTLFAVWLPLADASA